MPSALVGRSAAQPSMYGQVAPQAGANSPSMFGMPQDASQPAPSMMGNIGGFLNNNAMMLLQGGLGMMSGGPGEAMQGISSGSVLDMTRADRKKKQKQELDRLNALHAMMQKGGPLADMSPAAADYLNSSGDAGSSVIASRLLPKQNDFMAVAPGDSVFDKGSGKFVAGGDSSQLFSGSSVEGQALNNLVKSGQLTAEQANQLGAGKVVTNPADGSLIFMTPQGIFKQPSGQGGSAPQQQGAATPSGADQSTLPPGMTQLTQGKPNKAKSQGQVKGEVLIANAESDYQNASKLFDALGSKTDQAAGLLPGGRALQSGDYQVAADSVKNVVQSYIYAVSGAQAPDSEVQRMMTLVLPSVTDKPENKAVKKARLDHMMEAIRTAAREGAPPAAGDSGGGGGPSANDPLGIR